MIVLNALNQFIFTQLLRAGTWLMRPLFLGSRYQLKGSITVIFSDVWSNQ